MSTLKEQLAIMALAAMPATGTVAATAPSDSSKEDLTAVENTQRSGFDIPRDKQVKELSDKRIVNRNVYDLEKVAETFCVDLSGKNKLSDEQKADHAAVLRAATRYLSSNPIAIEDKYYHDNLIGKITDEECEAKIKEAKRNMSEDDFSKILKEEQQRLASPAEYKQAVKEFEAFMKLDNRRKMLAFTDKVDESITNLTAKTKDLSLAEMIAITKQLQQQQKP